ncbi:MAG: hypothetical protein WC099_02520 [Candidatus Paceibacterota bacterium]
MKKTIIVISCGIVFLSSVGVYAQEDSLRNQNTPLLREKRVESRQEIQEIRNEVRASTTQEREAFQEKRGALQVEMKNVSTTQEKSVLRLEIEKARQNLVQKMQTQRETLQTQVKKIKDTQKQETVLFVQDSLNSLNTKITNQLLEVTDKLGVILKNISSRTEKTKVQGIDVTTVETAIQTATNALQATRDAIKIQAGKTYDIAISGTGIAIQQDVIKARQSLMSDLSATRVVVQKARDTMQQAAIILAQLVKTPIATTTQ